MDPADTLVLYETGKLTDTLPLENMVISQKKEIKASDLEYQRCLLMKDECMEHEAIELQYEIDVLSVLGAAKPTLQCSCNFGPLLCTCLQRQKPKNDESKARSRCGHIFKAC